MNTVNISTGTAPTPYHIYDGFGLFIGGTCDFYSVKRLLENESIFPVQTMGGKALMGCWVCNFTDASLGPHHELQFSFFVSDKELAPIPDHPTTTLALTFTRRDIHMLCHGLWNNTPNVVAYNREILSLNAFQTNSTIERGNNCVDFVFQETPSGKPIASGSVKNPATPSLRATVAFMSEIGFRKGMTLTSQPYLEMEIINPTGSSLNRNAVARTFTKNDMNVIRYFDRADELKINNPIYQSVNFIPQILQFMNGIKFVYLQPR